MLCYVFKVRESSYTSKKDTKEKKGFNVALVALEGAKFALETFIQHKDNVFERNMNGDLSKVFSPGFWDIDIDEFQVETDKGLMYQKKIIKVKAHKSLDDAKQFL